MVVKKIIGGGQCFYCPGCEMVHAINTHPTIQWTYNNNPEKPTFSPSILVTLDYPEEKFICHSFVTDGNIQFLSDCTHKLKSQTVPLPQWPYEAGSYGGIDEE